MSDPHGAPNAAEGRLAGKAALVTGSAGGLGLAIARRFHREGARLLMSDIDGDAVRAAAREIGDDVVSMRQDVTSQSDWRDAVELADDELGGLHILVNNAGTCGPGSIEDLDLEDWHRAHRINVDSVFLGSKLSIPLLAQTARSTGSGASILNISSISAMVAAPNLAGYNSSKAAVRHLTKSIALFCAKQGFDVTSNSLHPAFVRTPLLDGFAAAGTSQGDLHAKLARQIPLGRLAEPDEVALAAVYLCSDEARFVTATELKIDGGLSAA